MPREAKVGGGVWDEYILLLKKKRGDYSGTLWHSGPGGFPRFTDLPIIHGHTTLSLKLSLHA